MITYGKVSLWLMEKPGNLREFFLLLYGHPVLTYCLCDLNAPNQLTPAVFRERFLYVPADFSSLPTGAAEVLCVYDIIRRVPNVRSADHCRYFAR